MRKIRRFVWPALVVAWAYLLVDSVWRGWAAGAAVSAAGLTLVVMDESLRRRGR